MVLIRLLCFGTALFSLSASCVSAEAKQPPKALDSSIVIQSMHHREPRARTYRSIYDVDFANARLNLGSPRVRQGRFQLKDGYFSERDSGGFESVRLERVGYLTVPGGKQEQAFVSLDAESCGGSCAMSGYVLVFALEQRKLVETEEISYDRKASGAGITFSSSTGVLTVTGRLEDDSPDCCPDALAVATFQWTGSSFRWEGIKRGLLPVGQP